MKLIFEMKVDQATSPRVQELAQLFETTSTEHVHASGSLTMSNDYLSMGNVQMARGSSM